eukprot:g15858.t1
MRVWEARGTSRLCFDADELGCTHLGRIAGVSVLTHALQQACADALRVKEDALAAMQQDEASVRLTLASGGHVDCRLVLAADGAGSSVRTMAGIKVRRYPLEQHALATVVATEQAHRHTALQCFLPDGPLALLPLTASQDEEKKAQNLVSVVWSQSAQNAQRRKEMSSSAFCAELTRASEACLGKVHATDQRFVFPLQQQCAQTFSQGRVVLLGDAARTVHPLAGLGVNLGFEDVGSLKALMAADGTVAQTLRGLVQWAEKRRLRSVQMIRLLDGLNRFYAQPGPGVSLLRNVGVDLVNGFDALKHQIMREAMGLGPIASVASGRPARD